MGLNPFESIFDLGKTLIERVIPDPKQKAEAMQRLAELQLSGDLAVMSGQMEINKIEAASTSRFVAGWRPFLGWVCASAFAIQFVIGPLCVWGMALFNRTIVAPTLDLEMLSTLLIGMLGLSGMRTYEKLGGAARNKL